MNQHLNLDDALSQMGIATPDLEKAKSYQRKFGGRIEQVLIHLGSLAEEALPEIYRLTLGYAAFEDAMCQQENVISNHDTMNVQRLLNLRWFPLHIDAALVFVTDNPLCIDALQHVSQLKLAHNIVVANNAQIEILSKLYEMTDSDDSHLLQFDDIEETKLREMASEAPTVNLFNSILAKALKLGASDIHFEPLNDIYRIRLRVDGVLIELERVPKRLKLPLVSRVKILSGMDIAEKRRPQDGKIEARISGIDLDIRVSALPLNDGESMVLRLLKKDAIKYDIDVLGVSEDVLKAIQRDIKRTAGVVLITGPTGSGKTTTLYTLLNELNNDDVKIISLEDPVEYQLDGVNQVQVNPEIDFDFAAGLRSIVRQDPDVIMLGEIRDKETATIALQSALTGHLVFSTVHTNDAPSAFTRLMDLGVEEFLLNAAVVSIVAQRLVRKLCSCSQKISESHANAVIEKYNLSSMINQLGISPELRTAVGCEACGGSGYKGRMAIIEYLECDEHIAMLDKDDTFLSSARKYNAKKGFRTLFEDGTYKALLGQTTIEEVIRVAG
ncbi:GspE/PulE family protein [Shewanella eurypsychrophilus]|uniref:GspE/PulE family protein n=2 Tax=Shewanellaceae TaxID=267890 RepID=A0ABX6VCX1_9GAMM|nr:type II secretion system protein GspE [Shewanella sp. YLB-09]QPG60500.1 GspE/PulE family protein [Shewanella eurypsychrophilus]